MHNYRWGEPLYLVLDCTYNLAMITLQSNYILRVNTLHVFAVWCGVHSWCDALVMEEYPSVHVLMCTEYLPAPSPPLKSQ